MFENRGSPIKQDSLEEKLRQILSGQEARKRIERFFYRITNGFYALDIEWRFRAVEPQATVRFEGLYPSLNSWLESGAYLFKDGLPVYSLDINGRKRAWAKLREHAEVIETINRVGQVRAAELNLL
jgi:hypothetical protein